MDVNVGMYFFLVRGRISTRPTVIVGSKEFHVPTIFHRLHVALIGLKSRWGVTIDLEFGCIDATWGEIICNIVSIVKDTMQTLFFGRVINTGLLVM